MAKTGYKTDYVIRNEGEDLSDLLILHRSVFPDNELATWRHGGKVIIKVANTGQVNGHTLVEAKRISGHKEKSERPEGWVKTRG